MARVLIDARESGTSTGRYVDKVIEYMHRLKPEFEVVLLAKKPRVQFLKSIAPSFKIVECNTKEFTFAEQIGLLKQIRGLKADLVHFMMPNQPVLYRGKTVTTIHDLTTTRFTNPAKIPVVFWVKQQVFKLVVRLVAHKSKHIITPSKFVKNDVAQYTKTGSNKITVTHLAADRITDMPAPVELLAHQKYIMYVGRPLPHKNLRRLMEAYSIIRNTGDGIRLVMVGKRDELYERHARWAQQEHIEGLVFAGYASEGRLRWLYEHAAAYVFPSLSEGFGLPGLEAMAHGAPVVSSNATCLPEIYGDAAEYFNPENIQSMVKAINNVLENPNRRAELKRSGAAQVKKYSWQKTAEQTLEVYRKILNTDKRQLLD
jgi:glycosyltransferase involved in cell wall biosynthesis